jgi:hypothetical protein
MRTRSIVLLATLTALATLHCGGETKQQEPPPAMTTHARIPAASATAPVPPPVAPHVNHSTPQHCDGDGTYAMAVSCFRETAGFRFVMQQQSDPPTSATGDMARPSPGLEKVRFALHGTGATDGDWLAQTTARGVAWFHRAGSWKSAQEPAIADRIFQQMTLWVDPQKREPAPLFAGNDSIEGIDCNHYRFTNANSGDTHDVWVSRVDGHLVRTSTTPKPELAKTFPATTITFTKVGETPAIDTVH